MVDPSSVNLRIPGPTPLPPAVRDALGRQVVGHRVPSFHELYGALQHGLRRALNTAAPCLLQHGGGTAAMEAAVLNFAAAGDRIAVLANGYFAERFVQLGERAGLEVLALREPVGVPFPPADVARFLASCGPLRAVFAVACETCTGMLNDVAQLAAVVRAVRREALFVVDAVSLAPAHTFEPDAAGVDVLIATSTKAMMGPPGYGIMALGPRAVEAVGRRRAVPAFLDLRLALDFHARAEVPFTPAVNDLYGLRAALELFTAEGRMGFLERHQTAAAFVRRWLHGLGLAPVAPATAASPTVTACWLPPTLDSRQVVGELRARHGVEIATGREPHTARVLRVAHMGWFSQAEMAQAMAALRAVLTTPAGSVPTPLFVAVGGNA